MTAPTTFEEFKQALADWILDSGTEAHAELVNDGTAAIVRANVDVMAEFVELEAIWDSGFFAERLAADPAMCIHNAAMSLDNALIIAQANGEVANDV